MDFTSTWLQGKGPFPKCLIMFIFAWFSWALWIIKNKMAIEKKFPKAPTDVLFVAISLMQKWSILLKEEDQANNNASEGKHIRVAQDFQAY